MILDSRRRISTEVKNAKTLTIVVRVRCLARRREPDASYQCGKARVGERGDRLVIKQFPHLPRQGTLPRYDKHLFFDSRCKARLTELNTSDDELTVRGHHTKLV